ncbi:MAG: type II secretion system protein [Steroidobacteraceae bacterium]
MGTPAAPQRGFTYLGLLMAVAVMGLMLTIVARVWATTEQREREIQLLFAGHQFRDAIAGYFARRHQYPPTLQDLLGDSDSPLPQRYLRRLYLDPMTATPEWHQIAAPGGGIMGVASTSKLTPLKRGNFELRDVTFKDADCYCAWQFLYVPRFTRRPAAASPQP